MRSSAARRAPFPGLFLFFCSLAVSAAPLPSGYVSFDDTGLGYPTFAIVNLTGDPACDASTGFVCGAFAFENGVLEVLRNGSTASYLLPGAVEPQSASSIEDAGWDFSGFERAVFRAFLVPRFNSSDPASEVIADLRPASGQGGLAIGDLALIEEASDVPEPGSGWLVLCGALAFGGFLSGRRAFGSRTAIGCARR